MLNSLTGSKSLLACWLIVIVIVICHFINPRTVQNNFEKEISFDCFSYYMYLPYTFIHDDVKMRDQSVVENIFRKYEPSPSYYQAYQLENGNWTPNYTLGYALIWLPLFFLGHLWALFGDYPIDGMSYPYQYALVNGMLLYILPATFILRKVLLKFFTDNITALTLLLVVFATNYFHEAFNVPHQSHAVLFTGYALVLYHTICWHENFKRKHLFWGGLVLGWMILARPSEIVGVFIPILWNVYNKESLVAKFRLVIDRWKDVLFLAFAAFIPFIPQMIYWKVVTGSWIFFSYQRTEGFDFENPHIMNVLFSFKKSLLVYTPIFLVFVIGLFFLRKRVPQAMWAVIIFTLTNFYLLASWAAWWNGGSYAMRYFSESFAVMSIPLGAVLAAVAGASLITKVLVGIPLVFFTFLNLFQTWQYANFYIPADRMNWAYYKRIFLKTKVTPEDMKLMEVERSIGNTETFSNEHEYTKKTIAYNDFDKLNSFPFDQNRLDTSRKVSGAHSFRFGAEEEWGPMFTIKYEDLVPEDKDHVWIRVSLKYFTEKDIKENPASIVINMPHKKYNLKYRAYDLEKLPSKPGEWNEVTINYMTPYPYLESDHFEIYLWHRGKSVLYIDDWLIESFEKK